MSEEQQFDVPPMPDEVEAAVARATHDGEVKAIVLRGAGRAFCAGYDFGDGFEHWGDAMNTDGVWDPGNYSQAPSELRPDPGNVIEP